MNDPDVDLMQEFARGNDEAFVTLYRRHRDRVLSYCLRLLGDRAQAEDATQDVFLKLHGARKSYEPKSRFSTFLYRIATHHCWNLRARSEHKLLVRGADVDASASRLGDAQAELERGALRQALQNALLTLPQNQRAALLLVHHEGLSYAEAAGVIDVSEAAIKSLVFRARDALSTQLAGTHEPTLEVKHAL